MKSVILVSTLFSLGQSLMFAHFPYRGYCKTSLKLRKRSFQTEPACLTMHQLEVYKAQFSEFIDTNNDGKASFEEVRRYLLKYNPLVKDEEVEQFIISRDTDGNNVVDFIPDYLTELLTPTYGIKKAKEWFRLEDTNRDGYVSRGELVQIAMNIGMSREDAEVTVDGYYMEGDLNGDGKLDWKEYTALVL